MGLFWWKRNNGTTATTTNKQEDSKDKGGGSSGGGEVAGMNGAVEVKRPLATEVTVFEFGSVKASADKVTLAGYCPVSEELEPCRWEILSAQDSDAPLFRVVF